MYDMRQEAKKSQDDKLRKYGADHKACGGAMKKYASGGKVHDDKAEDEALIKKEVKSEALKHRADGGPIADGGGSPKLGRGRKGGKKGSKTNIAIMVGKPGGDAAPTPPPALGAGPSPAVNLAPKPSLPIGPGGPGAIPPGAPPMKRGGKVNKK